MNERDSLLVLNCTEWYVGMCMYVCMSVYGCLTWYTKGDHTETWVHAHKTVTTAGRISRRASCRTSCCASCCASRRCPEVGGGVVGVLLLLFEFVRDEGIETGGAGGVQAEG